MDEVDKLRLTKLISRYEELCHAMQSGVAYNPNSNEQDPKHLRVGVNSAMVEHSALVQLLLKTKIIDELAYWDALVTAMEAEVLRYRHIIADANGMELSQVTLT